MSGRLFSLKRLAKSAMIWLIILLGCVGIFQHFVLTLPVPPKHLPANIDAVIVATGGQGRIQQGLKLLAQTDAEMMLITGVGRGINKLTLTNSLVLTEEERRLLSCCVDIDLTAMDTAGNAVATAKWAKQKEISQLLLVTANYHLPRAQLIFSRLDTDLTFSFWAVMPEDLDVTKWYKSWQQLRLLGREFAKYSIARLGVV